MSVKDNSLKEFMKFYLSDIIFDTTFRFRTKIHIMLIGAQTLFIIIIVILKIIFKENQYISNIISWVGCSLIWICFFFTVGTSIITEQVRKMNKPRINNFYKYLDYITEENYDEFGKEINPYEDETSKTSENN